MRMGYQCYHKSNYFSNALLRKVVLQPAILCQEWRVAFFRVFVYTENSMPGGETFPPAGQQKGFSPENGPDSQGNGGARTA